MYKALCLFRDQLEHIKPVEKVLTGRVEFYYDSTWDPNVINDINPDIVISINEHHRAIVDCYQRAKELNIPSLTIQDGVMEWRHLFENPIFNGNEYGTPLHHPVIADKIACIGPWWYNLIKELGNHNKVELTGMPKMDMVGNLSLQENNTKGNRILVLTSAKPWFYDHHKPIVIKMLSDLKEFFLKHKEFEPIWRVTKQLDKQLKLENHFLNKDTNELKTILMQSDAVISTVSTAMIESMLCGKPVARIDYFNNPVLFPTVWNITHKSHLESQVYKLIRPTPMESWLQEVYKDQVIFRTDSAAQNVSFLIISMIEQTKDKEFLILPADICSNKRPGTKSNSAPTLSSFYPSREAILISDVDLLRKKLLRTEWELNSLKMQKQQSSLIKKVIKKLKGKKL